MLIYRTLYYYPKNNRTPSRPSLTAEIPSMPCYDFYGIFVANGILQHCTSFIIAQLTGLLPEFPFHYDSQHGGYYLNMYLFILVGQRDCTRV